MSTTDVIPSEEEMELLSVKGYAIYDQKLKAILEPKYNGQEVAIHLDSGEYEIALNSPDARRALRARYPTGLILTTNIGPAKIDSMTFKLMAKSWKSNLS